MVTAEHHSTVQFIPRPNTHCESHALYMSSQLKLLSNNQYTVIVMTELDIAVQMFNWFY